MNSGYNIAYNIIKVFIKGMTIMYDVIIIGSGPAGLSASVYAVRDQLKTIVVEKIHFGTGQISESDRIENYLGLYGENGYELGMKFREHALKLGVEFYEGEATKINFSNGSYIVNFKNGYYLKSRSLIYAAGANHLKLGVKGEDEFYGKGVSYCATCDGAFYKGKTVTVVGGGDTAFSYALLLSKIAEKVYLVHRRSVFRANKSLQKKLKAAVNVEFLLNSEIIEIMGSQKIKSINLIQNKTEKNILTDGIFIAIGIKPNTALLKNKVTLDDNGYIIADENGITSVPGLFAAGDVRKKRLRQIVTAVSDGACCAVSAEDYLNKNNI
ncbi:thioredoxin-disulfide reductase [Ruminococcus sp. 25CYCFAH16]